MEKKYWIIISVLTILFTYLGAVSQDTLVVDTAIWKYLDDGSDQDTAWRFPDFIDTLWDSGPAELGYGDGDENTTLSFGGDPDNKYTTYYFRNQFILTSAVTTSYVLLKVRRDDGVIVYLNGNEVCRSNMPDDPIDYQTFASSTVGGSDEDIFFDFLVPSSVLTADTNLLAAEIHQRNLTSSDISFALELITTDQEPVNFRKFPYVMYEGDNDEMTVLWQLFDTMSSNLAWGTDTSYSMGTQVVSEYGTDHQHSHTVTGLSPATKYFYQAIVGLDTVTGHFRTAPDTSATQVTFFAYGDTRTYPADHDAVAERMVLNYLGDSVAQSMALLAGDLISDGDLESDWDNQFFDPVYGNIQELLRTIPLIAARGNHEGDGILYKKYFPYPYEPGGYCYWSFDYGPAHICVIDQYTSYIAGSTQHNWITADLAASDKPWKFLLFHEPGWSAGGGHGNEADVQNHIQPLCLQYGIPFVFAGHNHYYSRAVVDGIQHITTGGGGAPLRTPDPSFPNIVITTSTFHFCKIEIDADTLHYTVIEDDGTIIEEFDYYNYHEWTGMVDNDWNNPANWSMNVVPGEGWNVVVPDGLTNYPQVSGTRSCKNLQIAPGSTLTILSGGTLDVHGQMIIDGVLDIQAGATINQVE